ncbi:sugar transporter [Salmonella bongori]|nr:sugar transporter [Salmonella bongori]
MTSMQKWLRIGATLMFGLFVAYLDRSNLSVTLPTITHDLNIDGATASIVLTIFLIGYAFSNIFGGVFTQRYDPKKIVVLMVLIWSIATVCVGFTSSVYVILICRLVLGITEGIYWPQQSPLRQRLVCRKRTDTGEQHYPVLWTVPGIRPGIYNFVPAGCCLRVAKCFYYHWRYRHYCRGSTIYNNAEKTGRSALLSCSDANREN